MTRGKDRSRNKRIKAHPTKKNAAQINSYREFLSSPQNQPEDTVEINNENLTGTDFLSDNGGPTPQTVKPLPPPLKVRIKHFVESNGVWAVIITAAMSFVCWTVINIHENDLSIERLNIKIEYIEKTLDNLEIAGIDAEALEDELEELKAGLESNWKLSAKDIENRINIIELKIDDIISSS